jgi:glycogen operon protein
VRGNGEHDIAWHRPTGERMSDHDWQVGYARSLAVFLNGQGINSLGPRGEHVVDDDFLVLFNANREAMTFCVPADLREGTWRRVLDSARPDATTTVVGVDQPVEVAGFAVVVLQRHLVPTHQPA